VLPPTFKAARIQRVMFTFYFDASGNYDAKGKAGY
jgi:hypothetical protein